ncbi:MAG TPA: tetratricopeptide repeat protein [Chitinophagales bacterium]|nr:tetratricopeptide repeat protein [Chitinophagales bacterium]HMZ89954.1 tetratricopeptide repeat protein [Chitinophagales bacterium]HNA58434.1 tetratricopeptide repeat protein [Chitinophagales bacterium]HNE46865.1 tetratricopeptide repeat protein [Chitinophagales bacterium]HNF68441.1 tetratricopeptide repeat protein [Chitinophagales bacterium]
MKIIKLLLVCLLIQGVAFGQTISDAKHAIESEFYFKAKRMLLNMNKTAPSVESNFYLAEVYLTTGNTDSAKYYYKAASEVTDSKNPLIYVSRGKMLLLNNNATEAQAQFESAIKASKGKNAEIIHLIGDAYMVAGNVTEAISYYDQAYSTDPNLVINLLAYGDAYLSQDKPGEAMTKYEQAKAVNPNIAVTFLRIARINSKTGKHDAAIAAYKEAIRLDPNLAIAYKELGEESYLAGYYTDVKKYFDEYVKLNAEDKEARLVPAVTCYQLKDYACAIESATQIIAIDSTNFVAWRILYFSHYELGDSIRKTEPDASAKHFADGYQASQKFWSIGEKKLVTLDYQYSAQLAVEAKDTAKAIFYYTLATGSDSTSTYEIAAEYAKYLYTIKKYAESIVAYNNVIAKYQAGALDYYFLGRAYYQTNDYVNADTIYAQFIALQPNSPDGFLQRAKTKVRLDGIDERGTALPLYLRYIELAEKDIEKNKKNLIDAYLYCFSYYDLMKQTADACTNFNKAKTLDPNNEYVKQFDAQVNCPTGSSD